MENNKEKKLAPKNVLTPRCLGNQRVVALVDMDCFYCQVETRLNPSLKGKPVAVVQYNQWKGGGIIAVNYEARDRGVTRFMRGDEAKEKCPEIVLVSVPTIRGKADLSNYRDASDEVAKIFSEFSDCVQRASIDEAYLDLTKTVEEYTKTIKGLNPEDLPNTYVVGHCNLKNKNEDERARGLTEWLQFVETNHMVEIADYQLAVGGIIVEKMRLQILERTGFHCSAGIAHNKILAKLTAGLHKPKKQTILPHDSVPELYETLPIYKVRNLGGKLGKYVSDKLSIKFMSELYQFSLQDLHQKFDEKTSTWLYNIARGIDLEPITPRLRPESIGCCKNFSGLNHLTKKSEIEHWLKELATEISERLLKDFEKNKRRAKLLTVSFFQETSMTRCGPLNSYDVNKIVSDAMELLKKFNSATRTSDLWKPPIKYLGLSASKFTEESASIEKFLKIRKNDDVAQNQTNDLPASKYQCEEPETDRKSMETTQLPSTSQLKNSFFLQFLSKRKDLEKSVAAEKQHEAKEDENESHWISLSEIIPDVNTAEEDVVNILPAPLKKKFHERLKYNKQKENDAGHEAETTMSIIPNDDVPYFDNQFPKETCNECGKQIPLNVFLEHLDYHVALKLESEINRTASVSNKPKVTNEILSKRKKNVLETRSKKMKSITSFFTVAPKQN